MTETAPPMIVVPVDDETVMIVEHALRDPRHYLGSERFDQTFEQWAAKAIVIALRAHAEGLGLVDKMGEEPHAADGSRFYRTADGFYCVADGGGWLPGVYATREAGEKAIELAKTNFPALEDLPNIDARRPITVDDLDALNGAGK